MKTVCKQCLAREPCLQTMRALFQRLVVAAIIKIQITACDWLKKPLEYYNLEVSWHWQVAKFPLIHYSF